MRTLKLTIQYDGGAYVGWQRQAEGTSIQALVEDALAPIEGSRVTVHGAGRTDAGVHALAQAASVTLTSALPATAIARALNAVLPADVRITVDAMRTAGAYLVGRHDFAAYQGAGSVVQSTERTVESIEWRPGAGADVPLAIRMTGDGFLRHMVRNVVGALVEVGAGRWDAGRPLEALRSGRRGHGARTAPAHGLFLVGVRYGPV